MATDMIRTERGAGGLGTLAAQLVTLWSRQPPVQRAVAVVVLVAVAGAVGWIAMSPREDTWVTLVTATSESSASTTMAALTRAGVEARQRGKEVQILPSSRAQAREAMKTAGEPERQRDDAEATLFSDSTAAASQPSPRALEQRLARSLRTMLPIDEAYVHIAIGRRSVFKDREQAPSASVLLHVRPGHALTAPQIQGVQQIVARSVPGLRDDDVLVTNQDAIPLIERSRGPHRDKGQVEAEVSAKVRAMLGPLIGVDRLVVVTTAEVEGAASAAPTPALLRSLQVAILVDTSGAAAAPQAPELEAWTELARQAAGIQDQRGDVLTLQARAFAARPERAEDPAVAAAADRAPLASAAPPAPLAAKAESPAPPPARDVIWPVTAAAATAGLLALLALLRWRAHRKRAAEARHRQALQASAAARAPQLEETTRSSRLGLELARAGQVLGADVDATALVLMAWLSEDASERSPAASSPGGGT
jgi:flagellar biosynthesis/type III secretory pathway M-ring protein FliF/YscJ